MGGSLTLLVVSFSLLSSFFLSWVEFLLLLISYYCLGERSFFGEFLRFDSGRGKLRFNLGKSFGRVKTKHSALNQIFKIE